MGGRRLPGLLADPEAVRRVQQARADLDAGRGTSAEEMAALIDARRSGA